MSTAAQTTAAVGQAPRLGSTVITDPSGAAMSGRTPVRTLGQDEFFKLIAAQFSYQDPLNPQKDTDFIAQMAQFNTLEQTRQMQSDISGLRTQFEESQASLLLGQVVSLKDPATGNTVEGIVSEVRSNSGRSQVVVNGTPYDFQNVQSVQLYPSQQGVHAAPPAPSLPSDPLPFGGDATLTGPVFRPGIP
jgi:flagellar basal-body rod modification protein FlgD